MSRDTQDYLCTCTAAKMMETMTEEAIHNMALQNEQGRLALNHMLVHVYAPCMNYPAKELYYNNCISNPQSATMSKNPQALCECAADGVATFLSEQGPDLFEDILKRNPTATDPMAMLADDPKFQKYTQKK